MPDNQFNPGPYGSASTSYSSASGPNPQSAPSAATTWASPGQNAGILPPTDQKSLIGKPGLGLSVFWLVLGLITLAVGAGLASLNLTDATLPSLSSFSPGTSKSAQLEANRTYAFYAASTKLDSARQTSCVVSGPDGYSPTVTKANSSEELKVSRSYYKVATFSPNKSGSYSFACSNPNIDRADVFAIADITDTTTVTSSNDLIYARIFVGAGAFLGLVGLGLGIFGVIALIRKLKARRNFTDGLPAQGEDSASASSGAFSGYVPTTPGQDPLGFQNPLGFQAPGAAYQGQGAAAASQWGAAGAGAAGTAAAAAPQWGAPQGQWAAQAQSSPTQSSPAAQSQASAQSSNSSAQAASAHSAPQAPNPYVTVQAQPQTNPYLTPQAQQAPASQPAQPQSYAQSAQPAQPQANPYITAQAQPGQNVQPGQPIEVYGQQATQPLNPYLTQPQPQAQAQAQASVAQSAAQAGTPAGTQVGTPAGAQAGAPATAQGNAQAGSPAGAQGQNAAGYWPVPNFAPSDQAAQPGQFGQPDQFGQTAQAPQGYGQVPQGYGQPVQPQANPYVTTQAQQAPASQTAQPQSYAQSAQPAQALQVPQGYGQAQPGQNVQPGQPIEVYGQQATQPLNPYLTQPQPQTQPSVVPSAAQAPQGYGRPAQPGQGYGQVPQGYGQVPQGYGQVPQGYGQAQPVQPAQSVQQPAQVPGVSQLEHPNQPGRPTQPLQPTNDTRVIASPTDTTQVVFEPANPVYKSPASQSAASQQAGANEEVEETDQRPVDAMYTDPTRVISTTEAANRHN